MHTTLSAGGRISTTSTNVGDSNMPVAGIEVDWTVPGDHLGYEAGFLYGYESYVDFQEGYLGLRYSFLDLGPTPYVGAGISYVSVQPENVLQADFDSWGGYAHAGLYWSLKPGLFSLGLPTILGIDLRGMAGDHVSTMEARVFWGFGTP